MSSAPGSHPKGTSALWVVVVVQMIALGVLAFFVVRKPPTGEASGGQTLAKVQKTQELHVGYLVFDPCVVKDPATGKLSGTFVDAVEYLAEQLKVKVVYHETTLANFAAGLQSGQFDLSIGPTFRTIPRATSVTFCRPLTYIGNAGVVRKGDAGKYDTLDKLAAAKPRMAVLQGQAMEEFLRRRFPDQKSLSLSGGDLIAPLTAVTAGQADIGFMNVVTVTRYAEAHPEVEVVFTGDEQLELLALGWAVRSDDLQWWHFVNTSLDYLMSTGRWAEFQSRYNIPLLHEYPVLSTRQQRNKAK